MYQPTLAESLHEDVRGDYELGLIDAEEMRVYDLSCLTNLNHHTLSARELKRIRASCHLSQDEFADCLQVSLDTVRQWEIGKTRPKGAVRMLLDLTANQRILLNVPCCRKGWQEMAGSGGGKRMSAYLELYGHEPPCFSNRLHNTKTGKGNLLQAVCLPPVRELKPYEITEIRTRNQVDIFLFSCCMNVDDTTVRRWERGQCKPSGPSLQLLNLVDEQGVDFLIKHKNPIAPPLAF